MISDCLCNTMLRYKHTLTAESSCGGVIRFCVLKDHDTSAMVPLYANPTGRVNDVHCPGVINMEVLSGERQAGRNLIH